MTLQSFYDYIGGDYAGTKSRFVTDERILRFVNKFPGDGSFDLLKSSLAAGNAAEAFRAAHTLKGVAQNLGFNALFQSASAVTEILRGGNLEVGSLYDELEKIYTKTKEAISQLQI